MRYTSEFDTKGSYDYFDVTEEQELLEFLLTHLNQSHTKIKATLQGRGIKVNGKTVSQYNFLLQPGMRVAVSKTKRNQQGFKSRYVKIVYEDRWLIVVEKNIGILSMAAGHSSLNVKKQQDSKLKETCSVKSRLSLMKIMLVSHSHK